MKKYVFRRRMQEAEKPKHVNLIRRFCQEQEGRLTPIEFYSFMAWTFNRDSSNPICSDGYVPEMNEEIANFLFRGIANESENTVTVDEVVKLVGSIEECDPEYLVNVLFKSLDPHETGYVKVAELMHAAKLFHVDLENTDFMESVRKKYELGEEASISQIMETGMARGDFHSVAHAACCKVGTKKQVSEPPEPVQWPKENSRCCLLI